MGPQQLVKKDKVRIPFHVLPPELQMVISPSNPAESFFLRSQGVSAIIPARKRRFLAENAIVLGQVLAVDSVASNRQGMMVLSTALTANLAVSRHFWVKRIQRAHELLIAGMNRYGILQTKFEGNYPKDWINPTIVGRTHPIFDVEKNGDIVFRKVTRREYYQYLAQKSWVGKAGLNTWRWRGYLAPPKAPQTVKDWAKAKMKRMLERIPKPRLLPEPVPGFGRVQARHKKVKNRFRTFREKRRK